MEMHERQESVDNPRFFILGAAKAGTTSLHAWLSQHPAVLMSNPKEPFFFEAEFEKGEHYYNEKYFGNWDGIRLRGDARHRNLYLSYVPERIHAMYPNARFVVLLRNPVDRAYAHWWHNYRLGTESLPFEEALSADEQRIERGEGVHSAAEIQWYARMLGHHGHGPHRTYLDTGYYAEQLTRYFGIFRREQFEIILFDDLVSRPELIYERLCRFLGIEYPVGHQIDFAPKNRSGRLRWRCAKKEILARIVKAARSNPFGFVKSAQRKQLLNRPEISPEAHAWLRRHYLSHNRRLEELLGFDLAAWSRPMPVCTNEKSHKESVPAMDWPVSMPGPEPFAGLSEYSRTKRIAG